MAGLISTLDKFKGTLIGCAVGDALGMPLEGVAPSAIAERYGKVMDFIDARFGAGRVTDDTQMTVTLGQSIIEIGRFDTAHAAFKFGRWIAASDEGIKEARGVGMACGTACRRLHAGTGPEASAVESAGCGAAMRASPIGLRYYDDLEGLLDAARRQALLTHSDPEAVAGAVAVSFAVAAGINDTGGLDCSRLAADAASFVEGTDRKMAAKIAGLADYLDASPAEGFAYTGIGGYVMETVPAALFAFLRRPYDLEETVVTAVNAGGDADSIGAMAGAISGAFNGIEAVPERWRLNVEGRKYIEYLAERLYTLTPAAKPERRPLVPGFGT